MAKQVRVFKRKGTAAEAKALAEMTGNLNIKSWKGQIRELADCFSRTKGKPADNSKTPSRWSIARRDGLSRDLTFGGRDVSKGLEKVSKGPRYLQQHSKKATRRWSNEF